MKDRLPALDGLRGFAALSVVLGHAAIWNVAGNSPLLSIILVAFSAAHNAVQILFVLSGFLIAYLYPIVPHKLDFIKKRYARIFPIYGVVVIFLWFLTFHTSPWYIELVVLIFIAITVHIVWKLLTRFSPLKNIGTIVFYLFLLLQISVLVFHTLFIQHYIIPHHIPLSPFQNSLIIMLTNLTLTTQLIKGAPAMSGVFWSLGAEILFYILYPFIVVPLIHIARKGGWIISLIIILATTKILLDLDTAIMSIAGLNGLNIARATGFIAGVTIGTIYQTQGKTWKYIKKTLTLPPFGLIAIAMLILVQLGEHILGLGSIEFMNKFYLVTSWLISIVVLSAVIPNTVTNKIFRVRGIVYLGIISYSLYLIHEAIHPWFQDIGKLLFPFIGSKKIMDITIVLLYVGLSIILSYILYRTVEFLYFANKKKVLATTQASFQEKTKNRIEHNNVKTNTSIIVGIIIVFSILYSGMYSPTLLIQRHTLPSSNFLTSQEKSLLNGSITVPFTSSQSNLSVVGFDMRYGGSAGLTRIEKRKHAQLRFELLDENNKLVFSSARDAFEIEGSPRFQFGFPTIKNSKNKKYQVRLRLLDGKQNDTVFVNTSSTSFISIYTINRSDLLRNPFTLVINRLIFILTNPAYVFVLLFICLLVVFARIRL